MVDDDDRIVSSIDTAQQLPACQRMLMDWGLDVARRRNGEIIWRTFVRLG